MQPYQNYLTTQNPTFQNNYHQPMMNMSNPYMDRYNQLQQFQQNLQNPSQSPAINMLSALGKYVESIDMVKATDIPMDGNMYYFPKADGTEIFTKQWQPNGQTRILAFKPSLEEETVKYSTEDLKSLYAANKEVLEGIMDSLNTLNEKVDKIAKTNTSTKAKKESVADE